jgi:hypothetical protein
VDRRATATGPQPAHAAMRISIGLDSRVVSCLAAAWPADAALTAYAPCQPISLCLPKEA